MTKVIDLLLIGTFFFIMVENATWDQQFLSVEYSINYMHSVTQQISRTFSSGMTEL